MIKKFLLFALIAMVIDFIWIFGNMNSHRKTIYLVQKSEPKIDMVSGTLFYVLPALGFVLIVDKLSKSWKDALLYGMLLGLLMYGTFDLTNKTIFTNYPWSYTVADIAWGTICIGVSSAIVKFITCSNK